MQLAEATIAPLISIYDLETMPDDGNRYEIFEGELEVSRAATLDHQKLLGRIYYEFNAYLNKNPIGECWITPGVIFNEYNAVIPDLAFVTAARLTAVASGDRLVGAPDLAIEIISPGAENARRDNIIKRQIYAKFGVREYWIVEPVLQYIEISELQNGVLASTGKFRVEDTIESTLLPDFKLKVLDIFRA